MSNSEVENNCKNNISKKNILTKPDNKKEAASDRNKSGQILVATLTSMSPRGKKKAALDKSIGGFPGCLPPARETEELGAYRAIVISLAPLGSTTFKNYYPEFGNSISLQPDREDNISAPKAKLKDRGASSEFSGPRIPEKKSKSAETCQVSSKWDRGN